MVAMVRFFKVFLILFVFLSLLVGSAALMNTHFWLGAFGLIALTALVFASIITQGQD